MAEPQYISIDDDEEQIDDQDDLKIIEILDLSDDEEEGPESTQPKPKRIRPGNFTTRTSEVVNPLVELPAFKVHDRNLTINKTVELYSGDFLKINKILKNKETSQILLRGQLLRRNVRMGGLLVKKTNEVCFVKEVDIDNPEVERVTEVPLVQFKKVRKLLVTNRPFNEQDVKLRCWDKDDYIVRDKNGSVSMEKTLKRIKEHAPIVARWRFTEYISGTEKKYQWRNNALERLGKNGISDSLRVHDAIQWNEWREGHTKEQTDSPNKRKRSSDDHNELPAKKPSPERKTQNCNPLRKIDLNSVLSQPSASRPANRDLFAVSKRSSAILAVNPDIVPVANPPGQTPEPIKRTNRSLGQPLTYGDAFCGSGGTTRGALQAGLDIKWGVDFNEAACASWRKNFPGASCHEMPVFDFIKECSRSQAGRAAAGVDILHVSAPCQYYARCKTRPGPDDEMNTASLFAIKDMVELARPRVVTLEQTDGILTDEHLTTFFASAIHMLTCLNFSVRWKRVKLQEWGIPANRNRLIIIASCPGEILPQFPKPIHGPSGTRPFTTVNQALHTIPRNALDHNPHLVTLPPEKHKTPWNGDAILKNTITCDGGPSGYHPSGKRKFTVREFATLQGYPDNHIFEGSRTAQIKQIGNSVPSVCARVLYEGIRREIDREDGVVNSVVDEDEEGFVVIPRPRPLWRPVRPLASRFAVRGLNFGGLTSRGRKLSGTGPRRDEVSAVGAPGPFGSIRPREALRGVVMPALDIMPAVGTVGIIRAVGAPGLGVIPNDRQRQISVVIIDSDSDDDVQPKNNVNDNVNKENENQKENEIIVIDDDDEKMPTPDPFYVY